MDTPDDTRQYETIRRLHPDMEEYRRLMDEREIMRRECAALANEVAFYKSRVEALQQWQSRMRDPERTIVCDILANGFAMDPPMPHDRYKIADAHCWCDTCRPALSARNPGNLRMVLCPDCGNKRCPKATDHTLRCTDSNESGQPGSVYAAESLAPRGR